MALEVYYPQDILNALLAAEQASSAALLAAGGLTAGQAGEGDEFAQGYLAGYRAALATIALAFGLVRPDSSGKGRERRPTFLPDDGRL